MCYISPSYAGVDFPAHQSLVARGTNKRGTDNTRPGRSVPNRPGWVPSPLASCLQLVFGSSDAGGDHPPHLIRHTLSPLGVIKTRRGQVEYRPLSNQRHESKKRVVCFVAFYTYLCHIQSMGSCVSILLEISLGSVSAYCKKHARQKQK